MQHFKVMIQFALALSGPKKDQEYQAPGNPLPHIGPSSSPHLLALQPLSFLPACLICLQEVIGAAGDTLLNGIVDVALGKDRPLSVTLGHPPHVLGHLADVDQASLVQRVFQEEIPGGTGGKQPMAIVRGDYTVRGELVLVALEHVGVEIGRCV